MESPEIDEEDRDLPDPSDMDESDEPDLLPCPHCRRMINEDADWCHHCKQYVTHETAGGKWRVIVVGLILFTMVAGAVGWLIFR
jgi:hypothetical protein